MTGSSQRSGGDSHVYRFWSNGLIAPANVITEPFDVAAFGALDVSAGGSFPRPPLAAGERDRFVFELPRTGRFTFRVTDGAGGCPIGADFRTIDTDMRVEAYQAFFTAYTDAPSADTCSQIRSGEVKAGVYSGYVEGSGRRAVTAPYVLEVEVIGGQ